MSNYFEVKALITPYSEDASDLLSAFLAEEGYESFVPTETGLKAYIPTGSYDEDKLKEIAGQFPMEVDIRYTAEEIVSKDWNEEWEKNYFQPIVIDDRCVVHSSFHKDYPSTEFDIIIDPKMAFGTGHHATTSMMIRYLLETDLTGKSLIDMGTGTGILSILAFMRGASEVTAIEIDPGACENAEENFRLNDAKVRLINGDSSSLEECEPADYFLANINRNIILADMGRYASRLKKGGKMMFSGFFKTDCEIIRRAAESHGLTFVSEKEDGEWASLCFMKN